MGIKKELMRAFDMSTGLVCCNNVSMQFRSFTLISKLKKGTIL